MWQKIRNVLNCTGGVIVGAIEGLVLGPFTFMGLLVASMNVSHDKGALS